MFGSILVVLAGETSRGRSILVGETSRGRSILAGEMDKGGMILGDKEVRPRDLAGGGEVS
jgi:hypothetical protein